MVTTPKPKAVRIRMYQMGFGDCFMLTFEYSKKLPDGRAERHMLIDFGSTRYPKTGFDIDGVAEQIAADCNGALDVVAVSHRHKDHMSGFGIAKSGVVLDRLQPKLVVRSWTEDPDAPEDFTGGTPSSRFAAALHGGQALADAIHAELYEQKQADRRSFRGISAELLGVVDQQTLAAVGDEGLSNAKAYERLTKWGEVGAQEFLSYGAKSLIPDFIPGIKVHVLGPPTVDQHAEVTGARAQDPEYWMLHERLFATSMRATDLQADRRRDVSRSELRVDAGPVRWLVKRMQRQHINNLLRIVRDLDDALNNTSLILLIEAGDKHMLFPGDAQIENWNYALKVSDGTKGGPSAEEACELLEQVDFYKVGHHGSRNGTPRTLLEKVWANNDERDLVSMMGTRKRVHGTTERTAVPRETLVEALRQRTKDRIYSTASVDPSTKQLEQVVVEVSAKLRGGHPFEYVGPTDIAVPVADPTTELARH